MTLRSNLESLCRTVFYPALPVKDIDTDRNGDSKPMHSLSAGLLLINALLVIYDVDECEVADALGELPAC